MKIGIFTNYSPFIKLESEGLGRYLGGLIKGFIESGCEVTIACPSWGKKSIQTLLKDLSINEERVTFLTTGKALPIWHIYESYLKGKNREKRHIDYQKYARHYIERLFRQDKWSTFLLQSVGAAFASVLFSIAIALIKILSIPMRVMKKVFSMILSVPASFIDEDLVSSLFLEMIENTEKQLVDIINNSDSMDIWYVPALFWPRVCDIKNQAVVINAPDLVTAEYPGAFANIMDGYHSGLCKRTILNGNNFITYCDYIGRELIDKSYGGLGKKWYAIPHANHDLMPDIGISNRVSSKMNTDENMTREFAKSIVNSIVINSKSFSGKSISNVHYIFYASQLRPNKNLFNLIKGYEHLIHNCFRHEKLILTGRIVDNKEFKKYLDEHDLLNDVIFCSNVSNQQLAALYYCADLVVNPTLYEGGFPFTFGEGMSVGTPSIMSDIPQTRDVLEPAGLECMMFNPYDYMDIASKMEWALDNLDELYGLELPLYEEMAKRTDKSVAEEYLGLFKSIKTSV